MLGLKKSPEQFDFSDIRQKEINEFIRNARARTSPGNSRVSYKFYKYYPNLGLRLFALIREITQYGREKRRRVIMLS